MNNKKKVKICPSPMCGLVCDQYAMWCANPECKASLRDIPAVDHPVKDDAPSEEMPDFSDNEVSAPPRESMAMTTQILRARLECLDEPSMRFAVYNGNIAGRNGEIDLTPLSRSKYISRKHARFENFGQEGWQIVNLSQTNPTLVNGQPIPVGGKSTLSGGEEITLADTRFIFRSMH